MVLNKWKADEALEDIDLSWVPIWVQIHDIPPIRMNVDNAIKIGNYVGKFMELEKAPDLHRACKFLRLRVMMHTHVKLKIQCFIQKEDGQKKWLQFRYKRLPDFCYSCGKLDHTKPACPAHGEAIGKGKPPPKTYGSG